MKVPAALLSLALASVVVAQGTTDLPTCAQDCANGFLTSGIGNCGGDVKCICENKDFLNNISCCLADACGPEDQKQAIDFALTICTGHDVQDLPTEVACSTTAASTTGTAANPTGTGDAAESNESNESTSTNYGPRPTAAAGLGAIGGIIAAVALL